MSTRVAVTRRSVSAVRYSGKLQVYVRKRQTWACRVTSVRQNKHEAAAIAARTIPTSLRVFDVRIGVHEVNLRTWSWSTMLLQVSAITQELTKRNAVPQGVHRCGHRWRAIACRRVRKLTGCRRLNSQTAGSIGIMRAACGSFSSARESFGTTFR